MDNIEKMKKLILLAEEIGVDYMLKGILQLVESKAEFNSKEKIISIIAKSPSLAMSRREVLRSTRLRLSEVQAIVEDSPEIVESKVKLPSGHTRHIYSIQQ